MYLPFASWLLPSPEPSRRDKSHDVLIPVITDEDVDYMLGRAPLSEEDMAEIRERSPRPVGRLCRNGHRVSGDNAYRRSNGKVECRLCRRDASKRYRTRVRLQN
jgi:hypothetical protein